VSKDSPRLPARRGEPAKKLVAGAVTLDAGAVSPVARAVAAAAHGTTDPVPGAVT
jgi:hypothetical protein